MLGLFTEIQNTETEEISEKVIIYADNKEKNFGKSVIAVSDIVKICTFQYANSNDAQT